MRGEGRRAKGEGRRWTGAASVLPLVLLLAGCGGLLSFSGGQASEAAHAVLFVRPGCATFVARTLRSGFVVAEASESDYVPAVGDVLEGPAREGRSVFAVYPPGSDTAGSPTAPPSANVPLDLLALDLSLPEARARLDAACPPG